MLALTDQDRLAVATARKAVDESFHQGAIAAGVEALPGRAEEYVRARRAVARAHLPEALEASGSSGSDELTDWNEVARLVRAAIDDALIAILASDVLHPNHLRELYRGLAAASPSPSGGGDAV